MVVAEPISQLGSNVLEMLCECYESIRHFHILCLFILVVFLIFSYYFYYSVFLCFLAFVGCERKIG